ncbi:MAG: hypothetical protein ABIG45_07245 [Bacillota bacterium]
MEESHAKIDNIKDRYRELLSNLTGVFASNVDIAEDGSIREIHILGSQSRNPKQIARDVQSALASAFDIRVDHRIISIAQIPSDPIFKQDQEDGVASKDSASRFYVNGVWQSVQNRQYTVKVSLRFGDHEYEGSSSCGNTFAQRMRAASMATLEAVHSFFGTHNVFILLSVEQMQIAGTRVALTAIECAGPDSSSMLVGSAVYNHDETHTIIRATLSAINRKLTFMVPESG